MGIDDAGRGAIIGPMILASITTQIQSLERIPLNTADSKTISATKREKLLKKINSEKCLIQNYVSIPAQKITSTMFNHTDENLDHLNRKAISKLINIQKQKLDIVICDNFSHDINWLNKLKTDHPGIVIIIRPKADTDFMIVAAASILAKQTRDAAIDKIKKTNKTNFGSGYIADITTKNWLTQNVHQLWGFPDFVRMSWKPAIDIMNNKGCQVKWHSSHQPKTGR